MKRPLLLAALAALGVSSACLRRDVAAEEPTTKISFDNEVPQPGIDKIDLLVMVDNSSSMADKQRILADAVPDLVRGLVQPRCVDKKSRVPTGALADPLRPEGLQCAAGSEPAFVPITDMHIGVISSSLGGMGSSACKSDGKNHVDDKGRLLARGEKGDVAAAGDLHFLAWYPDVEQNKNKERHPAPPVPATSSLQELGASFRDLVIGVGQDGCGFEAQLESVYRFLVQPDPWTEIAVTDGKASYGPADHVDVELLRQRAAFLRPDSLVAVIMLSDEDDASLDPLTFQGSGWIFGENVELPRATGACETSPASPACTSCRFAPDDPACKAGSALYSVAEDPLNVRFRSMKKRYGVDPQFPLSRYVDAFTKRTVPSRASEHEGGVYVGKATCDNPLFAARLPTEPNEDLCKLPRGPRTPDLVYFGVIGGVPNRLLPADGDAAKIDWTTIVGKDPSRYDEAGIDPHMIVSTEPRPGLPGPSSADDADPVHGREWTTGGNDLQYACTFDLYERKPDGTAVPLRRACSAGDGSCTDCDGKSDAPLCAKTDRRVQTKGKAYPTRRELLVARALGDHAIVASLCPEQLSAPDADDYGYLPAVRAITRRLEDTLTASCLPRPLARDATDGSVPCLVLATLPEPGGSEACTSLGLAVPAAELLARVRDRVAAEEGEASRALPVCEVPQIAVAPGESCRGEDRAQGFCYAERVPGVTCAQALQFTKPTSHLVGARFSMQCITLEGSR
jgi:hypothetical protein